jgi:glutathione S-transferase
MASFSKGSKLPPIPVPVLKAIAPVITRVEMKANESTTDSFPADLRALPELLEHVDGLIADGVIGGEQPNAADLQIAPSLCLLMALGDLRPLIEPRPCGQLARRLFPDYPGDVPAGSIAPELLPAAA